jgi:hypothetical protein
MKPIIWLVPLSLELAFLAGCSDGVMSTFRERNERTRQNLDSDMRQLNDDWDSFWLIDEGDTK